MGGITFNPARDIPDQSGRVILVTGGNVGLGYESIHQLSRHHPAKIYLAARTASKATSAITRLKKDVPDANVEFLELDLASLQSVKHAAETFLTLEGRLDVLMNNAGIMACPEGTTREGYEVQMGTNHLGHALLTKLLLPVLRKTAAEEGGRDVRIVNLSSGAHGWAPKEGIRYATLKGTGAGVTTWQRYGQSKLANIYYARELGRREKGVRVCAVHPGFVRTNLIEGPGKSYPFAAPVVRMVATALGASVRDGVKNQLWAAVGDGVNQGGYYHPVGKEFVGSKVVQSEAESKKLWDWTEEELKRHGF